MKHPPSIDLLKKENLVQTEANVPLHVMLRCELSDAIEHHFSDGQQFWTEAMLAQHLDVSRITVRRALSDLARGGALARYRAKGTFVRKSKFRAPEVSLDAPSFSSIGVFIPHYGSPVYAKMVECLAAVCGSCGLAMQIFYSHKGETLESAAKNVRLDPSEQALVLLCLANDITRDLCRHFQLKAYRTVSVDTLIPDFPASCVGSNNEMGIRIGMRHLLDLGHRKIAFLMNEPDVFLAGRERIQTFEKVASEIGLTECRVFNCHLRIWSDSYTAALKIMDELWSYSPTAIFSVSETGAWAALKWLRAHEIQVPETVSVLGFDDVGPNEYATPPLSMVAQPIDKLMQRAIRILIEGEPSHEYSSPTLVARASTGPARTTP